MASDGGGGGGSDPSVGALRANLDRSLKLAGQMKQDNAVLKAEYARLKAAHAAMAADLESAKKEAEVAFAAKAAVEKECDAMYKQWNEHLKTQADEFAELQAQLVPRRELEMMRIQIAEQLEAPHRQRVAALSAEVAKWRDAHAQERREHELLKTRMAGVDGEHRQIVKELRAHHAAVTRELKNKCGKLQELAEDTTAVDELRRVERENAELHLRLKAAAEEAAELRRRADEAQVAAERAKIAGADAVREKAGEVLLAERRTAAMQRRVDTLLGELEAAQRAHSAAQDKCVHLERVKLSFDDKMETRNREIKYLNEHAEQRVAEVQRLAEEQRRRLAAAFEEAEAASIKMRQERDEATAKGAAAAAELQAKLKTERDECTEQLRAATEARQELQTECTALRAKLGEARDAADVERSSLRGQLTAASERAKSLEGEVKRLASRADASKDSQRRLREELAAKGQAAQEVHGELEALQRKHRDLMDAAHKAEVAADQLRAERDDALQRVADAEEAVRGAQEEGRALMERMRAGWKAEKAQFIGKVDELESTLRSSGKRAAADCGKLKRDKNRYKKMSLLLRDRTQSLSRELEAVRRGQSAVLASKDMEVETTQQRLAEVQQQRDALKMRLLSSSGGPYGAAPLAAAAAAAVPVAAAADFHVAAAAMPGMSTLVEEEKRTQAHLAALRQRLQLHEASSSSPSTSP